MWGAWRHFEGLCGVLGGALRGLYGVLERLHGVLEGAVYSLYGVLCGIVKLCARW